MKDASKVVLIDPVDDSRLELVRVISSASELSLAEVCASYQNVLSRIQEHESDLVILVVDADFEQGAGVLEEIRQALPHLKVIIASKRHSPPSLLAKLKVMAEQVLPLPTSQHALLNTVEATQKLQQKSVEAAARGPQVISVTAVAGGIGTSSIAVNLATSLARIPANEAVLVDYDLMFGSICSFVGLKPEYTIKSLIQDIDILDPFSLKRALTQHRSGLYLLPPPAEVNESAGIDPDELRNVLTALKLVYPSIVVDTSKGLQASDFLTFEMSDVILLVIQLEVTCLRNTLRLLQLFEQYEGMMDRVKLVVNRFGAHEAEISVKKAEETLRLPISWKIPNASKAFHQARTRGVPLEEIPSASKPLRVISEMASALRPFPIPEPAKPRRGLFAAFF